MARIGNSDSAALFADDPLLGKETAGGRAYLDFEVADGYDATTFFTDILLPIAPYPGSDPMVVLSSSDLNGDGAVDLADHRLWVKEPAASDVIWSAMTCHRFLSC